MNFDETGNDLTLLGIKFVPLDFVAEYRYQDGRKIGKSIRHDKRIELTFYDTMGIISQELKGFYDTNLFARYNYYDNGQVQSRTELSDTIKHGIEEKYNRAGELIERKYFKYGQMLKLTIVDSVEVYYPFIEAFENTEKGEFAFMLDFHHIDFRKFQEVEFHYDFADTEEVYSAPRYKEKIDISEIEMKFELTSMQDMEHIYGYLITDGTQNFAFTKRIKDLLD